jgi:hypothetical protein
MMSAIWMSNAEAIAGHHLSNTLLFAKNNPNPATF